MFAVIRTGGKQFKVAQGDVIEIEREVDPGHKVEFAPVLIVDDKGNTRAAADLQGASVTGKVIGETRGPKVKIFKYRNKTGYRRTLGHRQSYLRVQIDDIKAGSRGSGRAGSRAKKEEGDDDGT